MGQDKDTRLDRREFLASAAKGLLAAYAVSKTTIAADGPVKVVRVESPSLWNSDSRDPRKVAEMVHRGVMSLTGQKTPQKAWFKILEPFLRRKRNLRVGLKVNLLGRPLCYTAPEVTQAVAEGIRSVGLPPSNITVWDRFRGHFNSTRYTLGNSALFQAKAASRYDNSARMQGKGGSAPMAEIASRETDITIDLPVAKDHGGAGVTLALKNIAFGCYNHRTYNGAHGNACDPYIPEAFKHFVSRNPIPLVVLDATEGVFNGGPNTRNPDFVWRENAIYVASDPVAVDAVVRARIMAVRKERGMSDKTRQCHHIETAASMGLGTSDLEKIQLVTIKV